MTFYNAESTETAKDAVIETYSKMYEEFSEQKESDEYKTAEAILGLVKDFDFSSVQNIIDSDQTAYFWLNVWNGRVYINAKNRKGYRYPIKKNCLGTLGE